MYNKENNIILVRIAGRSERYYLSYQVTQLKESIQLNLSFSLFKWYQLMSARLLYSLVLVPTSENFTKQNLRSSRER